MSKIEPQDIPYLKDMVSSTLAGNFSGRVIVKLKDGDSHRWLRITPYLAEDDNGPLIIGTVSEITDEISNMQTISKYANKKNSMLHMLSHDLRGPLNIAKSLSKAMVPYIQNEAVLDKNSHISIILQQCIDLISDLVNREFLETTNLELVRKRVDIVVMLREYLEECRRSEQLSGIRFELASSSDKIYIKLDEAKFMQVINNLVSNSLKFTPPSGLVKIEIEETAGYVQLKFSDTGIGIPKAILPEIFDKFSPAGRPGLQGEPTLGLGLSIVKTIIGWHDGKISCQSIEGKGTVFFITLPKNIPY